MAVGMGTYLNRLAHVIFGAGHSEDPGTPPFRLGQHCVKGLAWCHFKSC